MGIGLDESGNVWTSNYFGDAIAKLAPTGDTLATYQVKGAGLNDLVIDKSGYVWATNTLSNTIVNIRPMGMITIPVDSAPRKIARDKSGILWIIHEGSSNVMKLDTTGETIATYLVCSSPQAIAIDNMENVWVATVGGAVNKLGPNGQLLGVYGASDRLHPAPHAVVADSLDNIWIANYGNDTVSVLSPSGKLIGSIALDDSPFDIAVDSTDNIWVAGFTRGTVTKISKEQATVP
jgi:streptogramin lyase